MKTSVLLRIGLPLCFVLLVVATVVLLLRSSDNPSAKLHSADLEYLKSVNSVAPLKDPELMFILMTEFAKFEFAGRGSGIFLSAA